MIREIFVPGRLCLFGEHSDWAGANRTLDPGVEPGLCLVTGTDQGIHSVAEASSDRVLEIRQVNPDGSPGEWRTYPADPLHLAQTAADRGFDAYIAGTASLVLERYGVGGLRLDVNRRTLPLKRGLSSSASICVTTARAFGQVYDLGLSPHDEMELAWRGELLTGSTCGRMDQVCAFGGGPVILTFDGGEMGIEPVHPARDICILIVDLNSSKDTRRILSELNAAFAAGEPLLRDALGPANRRMIGRALPALESGDAEALGRVMIEAQEVFDRQVAPSSPQELRAPVLHSVLQHPATLELAWGGKGVGSQGDGTAQFVCRGSGERSVLAARLSGELGLACLDLTIRGR
jgi:mevalonate kinase